MILYFSGTGNSRYAAEFLAQALGDQAEDVGLWIKEGRKGEFRADRPWVVVAPTYGWQLPHVLMEFLQTRAAGNGGRTTVNLFQTRLPGLTRAGGRMSWPRNKT